MDPWTPYINPLLLWYTTLHMSAHQKKKAYSFTTFNPLYTPCFHTSMRYLVYGRETTEDGVPFLRGYVFFKYQRTKRAAAKYLPDYSELYPDRGLGKAAQFCKKGGDYEEYGEIPRQGNKKKTVPTIQGCVSYCDHGVLRENHTHSTVPQYLYLCRKCCLESMAEEEETTLVKIRRC